MTKRATPGSQAGERQGHTTMTPLAGRSLSRYQDRSAQQWASELGITVGSMRRRVQRWGWAKAVAMGGDARGVRQPELRPRRPTAASEDGWVDLRLSHPMTDLLRESGLTLRAAAEALGLRCETSVHISIRRERGQAIADSAPGSMSVYTLATRAELLDFEIRIQVRRKTSSPGATGRRGPAQKENRPPARNSHRRRVDGPA